MVVVAATAVATAVRSVTEMSREDVEAIIDQDVIESAVDDRGIEAVADPALLESAIDTEELGSTDIDTEELQGAIEDQIGQ